MNKTSILFSAVLGVGLVYCLIQGASLKEILREVGKNSRGIDEVAVNMGRIQRYLDKLYFAGRAGNWDLAAFYLHEIQEQAEGILQTDVYEDEIYINPLIEKLLLKQVEQTRYAIEQKRTDVFEQQYGVLVERCNTCHQITRHGFIKIKKPEESMFHNQEFKPSTPMMKFMVFPENSAAMEGLGTSAIEPQEE